MRPVMEKRGFELRHVVYIIILIVCLIAIGIAVYMQFFKDEKIGLILGITKEQEDEEIKQLKENCTSTQVSLNRNTTVDKSEYGEKISQQH